MIEFSSVTKRYGPRVALDSVSFSAPAGAITAFCGPNGAGKSTALRVLSGIAPADEGTATVEGLPIGAHDRARSCSADCGALRSRMFETDLYLTYSISSRGGAHV